MSRLRHDLPDGGFVIYGDDPSFSTWYAQLYAEGDSHHDAPRKVIGYHPIEVDIGKAERPDMDVGPFPVISSQQLHRLVTDRWGIVLP